MARNVQRLEIGKKENEDSGLAFAGLGTDQMQRDGLLCREWGGGLRPTFLISLRLGASRYSSLLPASRTFLARRAGRTARAAVRRASPHATVLGPQCADCLPCGCGQHRETVVCSDVIVLTPRFGVSSRFNAMAVLARGSKYGLSQCKSSDKTLCYVKLTDSALKAIEEFSRQRACFGGDKDAQIQFSKNEGYSVARDLLIFLGIELGQRRNGVADVS
ncbi:unnamed protein product [Notodromas monacha]|uniref:RNA polymerase II elongation factor ELL N-terminal domain-containing protein n=1 Tax=Notodromas monacha TaxID=399045 RepID=A0A7R9BDZ3_9CRUS|nr:unnamed protein product [Notodromas monacha]CAG0912689.1 unnamed protein product [Notodromas monacha]